MSRSMKASMIAVFLLSVFIFQLGGNSLVYGIDASEREGKFIEWEIQDFNDDYVGSWWALDWSLRGQWAAQKGDEVNVTISKYDNTSLTDPFNGTISIGNFTAFVPGSEAAMTLILSIYPWNPGLITHTNWTWHEEQARAAANGTFVKGTIEHTIEDAEYLGMIHSTIKFTFRQDLTTGNQNTTLVYDIDTGILLYVDTEVTFATPYKLVMTISETDITFPAMATPGFDLLPIGLSFCLLSVYCALYRYKNHKKFLFD